MMARILVIDDESVVRDMLHELLTQEGHEVLEAPDGKVGIELYRRAPTDLVITDIFMPEKDGLETIAELITEWPDVKIIATSGKLLGEFDPLALASKFGAVRTIAKPFDVVKLLGAVRTQLGCRLS